MVRSKIYLLLVFTGLLLASCSKTDDTIAPTNATAKGNTTWVNYALQVAQSDAAIAYDVNYLTAAGMQTVRNHSGNLTLRVPVMKFDSAYNTYARTMLKITPSMDDSEETIVIHSMLKISTDNGFIIAQAGQTTDACGYNERTLAETNPISWFNY